MPIESSSEAAPERSRGPEPTSSTFDAYIGGGTPSDRSDEQMKKNDSFVTANGFAPASELLGTSNADSINNRTASELAVPAGFSIPKSATDDSAPRSERRAEHFPPGPDAQPIVLSNPLTERPASVAALGDSPSTAPPERRPEETGDRVEQRPDGTTATTTFDASGRARTYTVEGKDAAGDPYVRETNYNDFGLRVRDMHGNDRELYTTVFGPDGSTRTSEFKQLRPENGVGITYGTEFDKDTQRVKSTTETRTENGTRNETERNPAGEVTRRLSVARNAQGNEASNEIGYDKGEEVKRKSSEHRPDGSLVMEFTEKRDERERWSSELKQPNPDGSTTFMRDNDKKSSTTMRMPSGSEVSIEYDKRTGETVERARRGGNTYVRQGI